MHRVTSDVPVDRAELVPGRSSKYYGRVEEIQVLEVEVSRPGSFVSEVTW